MKKKPGSIFLKGFLKSLLYIVTFMILFFASFELTGIYLGKNHTEKSDTNKIKMELKGSVDPIAYNLIYAVNEKSHELEHVVLEILNTNNDCLMYMTIPTDAKFAMSSELYKKAYAKNQEIPQILSFSSFKENVKPEDYYDFGATLLEDALDMKVSFCTVVSSDIFDDIFAENDGYVMLSDDIQKMLEGYTEDDIISYLTKFYKSTNCNLTLQERLTYTPALSGVSLDEVIFTTLPGEADGTDYNVDKDRVTAIFNAMKENRTINEMQGLVGSGEQVSLAKNIKVLNGSGITGLASNIELKLEQAGYTVYGIGNYTSNDVENTVIQVKEKGLGQDLVQYFRSATVEINEDMPSGIDIQIILGKSESMS